MISLGGGCEGEGNGKRTTKSVGHPLCTCAPAQHRSRQQLWAATAWATPTCDKAMSVWIGGVQGAHKPPSCLVLLVASYGQPHTVPVALVQEVGGNAIVDHVADLLSQLLGHPGATLVQGLHKERLPQVFHCEGAMCGQAILLCPPSAAQATTPTHAL
jgi:hypothetical protein